MYNEIAQKIAAVIGPRQELVDFARKYKGGYEGWLQVELANQFKTLTNNISREVKYPRRKWFCDLVVDNCYIELKTETEKVYKQSVRNTGILKHRGHGTPDDLLVDAYKLAEGLNRGDFGYAVRISKGGANLPPTIAAVEQRHVIYEVNADGTAVAYDESIFNADRYYITIVGVQVW